MKLVGEEPDEALVPQLIPLSFTHKHVFKRILIVFAGPLFNMLLAVVIFFVIALFSGILILKPTIGTIKEGSPAHAAGLQKGDRITANDGVALDSCEKMADTISRSNGRPLDISVVRESLGSDPYGGVIYVFRAKRGDRVKLLFWDGSGLVMSACCGSTVGVMTLPP